MLWTEKYRPQKIDEIVGQEGFISDARHWGEGMPNLLLYGPAGVGKTASAGVVANLILGGERGQNFFEINASDDRRLEVVRTTIKEIATTMKEGDVPHKIILLDEMDGMTPDAQNALKRIMERYSGNVRFIITCNHRSKIIYPLQSRCANYQFKRLTNNNIKWVLERIMTLEGIPSYDEEPFDEFIGSVQGDMRRAITELQASVHSNTPLSIQIERMHEPYNKLLDSILNKQYESALTQLHEMLYLSVDIKVVCESLHDVVLKRGLESGMKFKLLRVIGEAEWRSANMTPKVLASWMIGQMI
jgi:replication factor C small subunit